MSRENPWSKHRQSFWQEKAGSPNLALWQRVYALAYGVHRRNGHAPFKVGEIALGTTVIDPHTGEVKQPDKHQVSRAIATAVEYGFLHRDSCARCLVVPPWGIEGGLIGSPSEKCRCHSEATHRLSVVPERQPGCHSETTDNALTCGDATALYDSSNPAPNKQPKPHHRRPAS